MDWTASSDQAWLTVMNGSGMTPDSFQLTADPTSLPMEAISYANVTVSSTDPRVTNTEIVRVGLYRTASPPTAQVERPLCSARINRWRDARNALDGHQRNQRWRTPWAGRA